MRLFLAVVILAAGAIPAGAQWLDRPTPGIPRTADGKPNLTAPAPRGPDGKPDLSGVWRGDNVVGRPAPTDLQPWVLERAAQYQQEYYKTRPFYQCRPSGPEAELYESWRRIIQTPANVAILQDDLTYRVIHTDGRALEADPAPSWSGYSVGRWEGDTFVVESNGFNDKTWTSRYGISHTEKLRVTERYRRSDFGHMRVDVTFTDPDAYTRPWGFFADFTLAADTEMLEAICEKSSEQWAVTLADLTSAAPTVPPDVLAKYVGVYSGIYGGRPRTFEITLQGGKLIAKITGEAIEGGLGATGLDEGAARTLIPQSETVFDGLGLGFRFVVDDKGAANDLVVIHISGPYTYHRVR
jgi:hypothetical protein